MNVPHYRSITSRFRCLVAGVPASPPTYRDPSKWTGACVLGSFEVRKRWDSQAHPNLRGLNDQPMFKWLIGEAMNTVLTGNWVHRSFRNDLVEVGTKKTVLAAPWAPPGKLQVTTSETGEVSGRLKFPSGAELSVTGKVSDAIGAGVVVPWALPPSVVLTAITITEPTESEYHLRGWFIPDSNTIVGTVMSVKNDLAQAPDGTQGPWVLVKAD